MKSAKRTKPRQRRRATTAPLGLKAVFGALQPWEFTNIHGYTHPEPFLGILRAIEETSQQTDHKAFTRALTDACDREYQGEGFGPAGDRRASEEPQVAIIAGFWAGVTACWQVMNAINGKDGAR